MKIDLFSWGEIDSLHDPISMLRGGDWSPMCGFNYAASGRYRGGGQGLSRYLETGCPNRGFIDFCVSKVWYKIHTTNKIDPIPLQIMLF